MVVAFSDNLQRRRTPFITFLVAFLCTSINALIVFVPEIAEIAYRYFAFVPKNFSIKPAYFYTLVTAEFLHAGWAHLIGNLIFLFAFGRSIEDLVGRMPFLLSFVSLGGLAFIGSWLMNPGSPIPIVGMSGALSFLIGTYTVVFPRAKLRLFPFLRTVNLRAWLFSLIWLAMQIWSAFASGEADGTAYNTHLAGFAIGVVAGMAWKELALDTDQLIDELKGNAP
jgi:membrane associated rhomboid family serine protease